MSAVPVPGRRLVRILHEDPELGRRLDGPEAALAARQTVGSLQIVRPGPWHDMTYSQRECRYGGLILEGLVVRELSVGSGTSAELLGTGDLVLPRDMDDVAPFVAPTTEWTVLEPVRVAWLDASFGVAMRRWPELGAALLERCERRFRRIALSQAVSQLTRVDERVHLQLWQLAERWGRVRSDGILLPLKLTHRVIARLIGARRPSVSTALGTLERESKIKRFDGGGYLLLGDPPNAEPLQPAAAPWQHGHSGAVAIARLSDRLMPTPLAAPLELSPEGAVAVARARRAGDRAAYLRARSEALSSPRPRPLRPSA